MTAEEFFVQFAVSLNKNNNNSKKKKSEITFMQKYTL